MQAARASPATAFLTASRMHAQLPHRTNNIAQSASTPASTTSLTPTHAGSLVQIVDVAAKACCLAVFEAETVQLSQHQALQHTFLSSELFVQDDVPGLR